MPSTRAMPRVPGLELPFDRGSRDERDAVSGADRALDRLLKTQDELCVEVAHPETGTAQLLVDDLANTRTLLHHDEGLGAQLVERHLAAGGRVLRRHRQHDLVQRKRLEVERAVPSVRTDDAELELARRDLLGHGVGVRDRKADSQVGVLALELAKK